MSVEIKKPRVIVFDLETLYMILAGFGLRDQNFSPEQVIKPTSICSFAAKVVDSDECLRINTNGSRNDKALIKKAIKFLLTADVLVSQNGIRFDLPKINSRAIMNKLGENELHRKMHIDLYREGKRLFGHDSHKLAWLSRMLTPHLEKSKHKEFPGFDLWIEVDKSNPRAIKEMDDYNWQDVLATEAVYKEYVRWLDNINLNRAVGPKPTILSVPCRVCSGPTVGNGTVRRLTGKYRQYLCQSCGTITTPTTAGFNLDIPKKAKTTLTPSKAEVESLKTESKLLAKDLKAAEDRIKRLMKAQAKKGNK